MILDCMIVNLEIYGLMLSGVLSNRKVLSVPQVMLYVTLSLILIEKGTYSHTSAGQGGLLAGAVSDVLAIGDLVAYSDAIVNKWKRHLYVTLSRFKGPNSIYLILKACAIRSW